MANHVIRDRIWESRKLAGCSRDAALAYPWIFLVADDHGRFEFDVRRIWSKVFGARRDVSLRHVTTWLGEYQRVGLLVRYHPDRDLAAWTNFQGRPPTQRRPSNYPDPQPFIDAQARERVGDDYSLSDQIGSEIDHSRAETEARPRRRSKAAEQTVAWTPEQLRAPIEAYNAVFESHVTDSPGNLRAAVRAFEAGYTLEQMRAVFEAVRARKTPTAAWCADNNREFEYLIRPSYKHFRSQEIVQGPLDKVPNELATGRR